MKKVFMFTLALLLFFNTLSLGQSSIVKIDAERIRRYEQMGSGGDAIMEATFDLMRYTNQPIDAVVRVCSKEPMPLALATAAMNPFKVARWMQDVYKYSSDRILFLRSKNCLGPHPEVAATELWAVPKGATLPSFVEAINSAQASLESVGTKDLLADGTHSYKTAANKLITKLRARSEAVGIVLGYYYDRPSPAMRRRLLAVRRQLKKSGLSQDRYAIRLTPWNGERSIDPPEREPVYPSIFIIEIRGGKRK